MLVKYETPFGSVECWKFTSTRGAKWDFEFQPPYCAYGPLIDGSYGVTSKKDRRGNVLIKPSGTHHYMGCATREIARQIARKWNGDLRRSG